MIRKIQIEDIKIVWTFLLLLGAVVTDLMKERISNRMIGWGILTGLFFQVWELGDHGLAMFLLQISFPVVLLYLMFLMHALGAGDIKLFSMIGSIWDLKIVWLCMLSSFSIGALISLCKSWKNKNLLSRIYYFCGYIQEVFRAKKILPYEWQSDGNQNIIHFSIPILIGYIIALIWR